MPPCWVCVPAPLACGRGTLCREPLAPLAIREGSMIHALASRDGVTVTLLPLDVMLERYVGEHSVQTSKRATCVVRTVGGACTWEGSRGVQLCSG